MRVWSWIRRFSRHRLTVGCAALALPVLGVMPGDTSGAPCERAPHVVASPAVILGELPDDPRPRTGIDLELRILNLRIEFPWMRALPVSPGHSIVIALLADDEGDDRRP